MFRTNTKSFTTTENETFQDACEANSINVDISEQKMTQNNKPFVTVKITPLEGNDWLPEAISLNFFIYEDNASPISRPANKLTGSSLVGLAFDTRYSINGDLQPNIRSRKITDELDQLIASESVDPLVAKVEVPRIVMDATNFNCIKEIVNQGLIEKDMLDREKYDHRWDKFDADKQAKGSRKAKTKTGKSAKKTDKKDVQKSATQEKPAEEKKDKPEGEAPDAPTDKVF